MSNDQVSKAKIQEAEKRLTAQLNYGGIHLNRMHSPGHLSLEYQQGDLVDEVAQMRVLASAFMVPTGSETTMKIIKTECSPELKLFDRHGRPFAFVTSGDCTGHTFSVGPTRMGMCSNAKAILQSLQN
jgi:hypothetical protein